MYALALPPSSTSDPGSHGGPFSPLPSTAIRAFVFIARIIQHFLPWSIRVDMSDGRKIKLESHPTVGVAPKSP